MIKAKHLKATLLTGLCTILMPAIAISATIKGTIIDKTSREPLIGATITASGSSVATSSDLDGNFVLTLPKENLTITVTYIGYHTVTLDNVTAFDSESSLLIEMTTDSEMLQEVTVTARANRESERVLQVERKQSTLAVENLGAIEMSSKGISDAQEGVTKISGISIAASDQLIVRGLGDRYSITTLNGIPIASPNPDNKLIPLNLFPSSTIQNITVSKVYNVASFADYSGAHINIDTKDNVAENFFNVGIGTGGKFNTFGHNRYQMDRNGSLFSTPSIDDNALKLSLSDFDNYVKAHDIFKTSFQVSQKNPLPDFSTNIGAGHNFKIGDNSLSILASGRIDNEYANIYDALYRTLEASGNIQNNFTYDSYTQSLKTTALAYAGYSLREYSRIGYTFLYSRDATDTYQKREGYDAEGHNLIGSNNTTHIYKLMAHQLNGVHRFGDNDKWAINWCVAYNTTSSSEPDRRQVMFEKDDNGTLHLFKLNRQETMRYFGELNEDEWNAKLSGRWKFAEANNLSAGFNFKSKRRDYMGTRFYYNVNRLNPDITNIYDTDTYLNQDNVANGSIVIERKMQPKDSYLAGNDIYAAYISTDYYLSSSFLLNAGVRGEVSRQWVKYATDGGERYGQRRDLNCCDFFPSINIKYTLTDANSMRASLSRTVTRPAFIEMAPFLYQESYGSAQIRGNENLQNGYNYNFDLRFERIENDGDIVSATAYFKYLDSPIERIQALQGGATLHSFQNADNGIACGLEAELRKSFCEIFKTGINVSYMYTNVRLPENGAYTNKERSLQGASPILLNADVTCCPRLGEDSHLSLSLLYNLQGARIYAVGVSQLGDVKQRAVNTLDFTASYEINRHVSLSLAVNDILNQDAVFKQNVPTINRTIEVERYKRPIGFSFSLKYNL